MRILLVLLLTLSVSFAYAEDKTDVLEPLPMKMGHEGHHIDKLGEGLGILNVMTVDHQGHEHHGNDVSGLPEFDCVIPIVGDDSNTKPFTSMHSHHGNMVDHDSDEEVGSRYHQPLFRMTVSKTLCPKVGIMLHHMGKNTRDEWGHNWVLSTADGAEDLLSLVDDYEFEMEDGYLPHRDIRIIAMSHPVLGGGKPPLYHFNTIVIDITKLRTDGEYNFFCSFPGHTASRGQFIVKD